MNDQKNSTIVFTGVTGKITDDFDKYEDVIVHAEDQYAQILDAYHNIDDGDVQAMANFNDNVKAFTFKITKFIDYPQY